NPKRFQIGVGMLGMTADQLQKGMVTDPQSMILDVLTRIKKLPVEQQMEAVTRLFGKDWGGAIAKLANGVDEYRRQLALANGEAAKGSMSREFKSWQDSTA
ncbi:phage tail tape measure protein, partial [Xylella fastidiosa subsp. multiplex]